MSDGLTHLNSAGQAHMVDVTGREITVRIADTSAQVNLSDSVVALLRDGATPKGDVLSTARIAGIMAAKKTSELIPLCHPIAINTISIDLAITDSGVAINARVITSDRTGVEMEALTAVSVAGLTIIDMVKALDPAATITDIRIDSKSGGKNGDWKRA
ncbi:MAG: cyclic pyranopterin monophosphate synthase MoaC [Actinobacteria bacterium]|uniref:cyclic pyranopterin monophosphate synthase n=1 Tax=freshwater metagenome TaxID=449393 RepID=A0A6J7AFS1_9ZZZZ|nr:cyclic pyranopterin monophosphate synthase MoaC [Actinomycetota bacterium]MTB04062.1 cyclic pyranopterin monophosphate synthase MoaC [Actinomycetota bacterium]